MIARSKLGHCLLYTSTIAREELRRALDGVLDLERLLSRVTLEAANPRDVLALAASLKKIPAIKAAVARLAAERLKALHGLSLIHIS